MQETATRKPWSMGQCGLVIALCMATGTTAILISKGKLTVTFNESEQSECLDKKHTAGSSLNSCNVLKHGMN